jgi:hypothetical protein
MIPILAKFLVGCLGFVLEYTVVGGLKYYGKYYSS